MSSSLDLVVLNGPLEGTKVQLRPNAPLVLGRSHKGLQLVDPLVSLSHAEITWEGDRYWLQDKASATGTFVNDVRLTERAVQLVPGMRIRLGETDLEVRDRPGSMLIRVAGVLAALLLLALGVKSFMEGIEVRYDPVLKWYQPVQQGAGYASQNVEVPRAFVRTHGVDHRQIAIEQVSDFDKNGIDELWLAWEGGREVVTFNPDGSWRTVAKLRADCRPKGRVMGEGLPAECYQVGHVATDLPEACHKDDGEIGFPDLDCTGTTHRFVNDRYVSVEHEGVYAWMPPTAIVDRGKRKVREVVEGPPGPSLFTLVRESEFAGFLAERGIVDPIHYLICEDAVRDVRAQVLTEAGELIPLGVGCIGDITLDGPTRFEEFGPGIPTMFAFTGVGYEALLQDLAVYLSGSDDLLFMRSADRPIYDSLAAAPNRRRGGIRLAFQGPQRIFNPVASETPVGEDPRQLLAAEFTDARPRRTETLIIDGTSRYDLRGCGELEVKVNDWHCLYTKGCSARRTFATLQRVGCDRPGPVVDIPYADGITTVDDPMYPTRVSVESVEEAGQIDVLRVRFAYRMPENVR